MGFFDDLRGVRSYGDFSELMRQYQAVVLGVCGVVLVLAAVIAFTGGGSSTAQSLNETDVWFYDLESKEWFIASSHDVPPITAPSGGVGVRAFVYGCGDCSEPNRFIGYLARYTPDARPLMAEYIQRAGAGDPDAELLLEQAQAGLEITSPDTLEWRLASSSDAHEVFGAYAERCGSQPRVACSP